MIGALLFTPEFNQLSPSAQLDLICKTFSRDGFQLDWYPSQHHLKKVFNEMSYGDITFTLNGEDAVRDFSSTGHNHAQVFIPHEINLILAQLVNLKSVRPGFGLIGKSIRELSLSKEEKAEKRLKKNLIDGSASQETEALKGLKEIQALLDPASNEVNDSLSLKLSELPQFSHILLNYPQFYQKVLVKNPETQLPRPEALFDSPVTHPMNYFRRLFWTFTFSPDRAQRWFFGQLKQFPQLDGHASENLDFFEELLLSPQLTPTQFVRVREALRNQLIDLLPERQARLNQHFDSLVRHSSVELQSQLLNSLNEYQGPDLKEILLLLVAAPKVETSRVAAWRLMMASLLTQDPELTEKMLLRQDLTLSYVALSPVLAQKNMTQPIDLLEELLGDHWSKPVLTSSFQSLLKAGADQNCFKSLVIYAPGSPGLVPTEVPLLTGESSDEDVRNRIRKLIQKGIQLGDPELTPRLQEIERRCF